MIFNNHEPAVAVLYENDEWLDDFFKTLDDRDLAYRPVRMDDAAVLLDELPPFPLVFNRTSPSSYLRVKTSGFLRPARRVGRVLSVFS